MSSPPFARTTRRARGEDCEGEAGEGEADGSGDAELIVETKNETLRQVRAPIPKLLVWPACLRLAFSFVTRSPHLSYVEDHDLWRVSDSLKPELLTQGKLSELK